jgi:hypothetical protein
MFVRSDTAEHITLAKGHLTDRIAVGTIVVESVYRVLPGALERTGEPPPRGPWYPPDTSRFVLWREVSVTASGTAFGPPRPPHVCPVSLTIGQEIRRAVVLGPRRWQRTVDGDLEPSVPEPFDALSIGWERAFGGGYVVPPGIMPGSGLPHPGVHVLHPLNRFGVGFYPDKAAAVDQILPSIERPEQLLRRWTDQPTPAGFSSCPDLGALRLPRRNGGHGPDLVGGSTASDPTEAMIEDAPLVALRTQHHAPGELIFDKVSVGTVVLLAGLGASALRVEVPTSPIRVRTRRRRQEEVVPARLRSLHIDADTTKLVVAYGHTFRYDPEDPPPWILVSDAA